MWILLGVLFSLSASALEPFETIKNIKILRVYPNNIVEISRGLDDGLLRNDHIKISNDTLGYASRALCIRVKNDTSIWKIYRVPYAEAFSMDYTYSISSLADREIPMPQESWKDNHEVIEGLKEEKASVEIRGDLPQSLTEAEEKRLHVFNQRKLLEKERRDSAKPKNAKSEITPETAFGDAEVGNSDNFIKNLYDDEDVYEAFNRQRKEMSQKKSEDQTLTK